MKILNICSRFKHNKNEKKNRNINRNINHFILEHSQLAKSERESSFIPEVLIPCYNHGRYLFDALSSIPKETKTTIINDASTDDTADIIDKLKKDFNFRLITNHSNLNQSGSLNKAIETSNSNLFIILNADDVLVKYCISLILKIFTESIGIRMLGGGCIPFKNQDTLRLNKIFPSDLDYLPKMEIYNSSDAKKFKNLNDINMTMSGSAFLKSAWKDVGGFFEFNDRVCSFDDRDFQMRVCSLFDIGIIDEPMSLYRTVSSLKRAEFI